MGVGDKMSANSTPTFNGYTDQKPMRFWCQTILPLVYDDALSYYEVLAKIADYLNNIIIDLQTLTEIVEEMQESEEEE